ncbi:lysozyme C-like isoform X1 [Cherax quadricarinatus]
MRMLACSWLLVTAVLTALVGTSSGKVYRKCELASVLERQFRLPRYVIKKWVCIAEFESRFNTAAINPYNYDGSKDYGIFQINSMYWCWDGTRGGRNLCGIRCRDLLSDNLSKDVSCALKILNAQGYSAWVAYNNKCRYRNLDVYMAECWGASGRGYNNL